MTKHRFMQPDLPPGQRVRLKPLPISEDFPEGANEEFGYVLSSDALSGTAIVHIDEQYRDKDDMDDGLREVPIDQLEVMP